MKRYYLSDSYSLFMRKYLLSTVFVLLSLLLFWKGSIGWKFAGIPSLAIGVFYACLRKIAFDEHSIYIGNTTYTFQQIVKIGGISINQFHFPSLVIHHNGRERYFFTDIGQAGMLRIIVGILIPSLNPFKNLEMFKKYWDASKNIL